MASVTNSRKSRKDFDRYRSSSKRSMAGAIHHAMVLSLIIMAVEIAAFITVIIFFYFDLFNMKSVLTAEEWLYIAAGVAIIDFLFLWLMEIRFAHIRQSNDLDASRIIGADVQEAYNFGELGLVVTDEENCVVWVSPLIKDRHIDILDCNLLDWRPELDDLSNPSRSEDNPVQIEVNSCIYQVKYIPSARLYIFRDVTDMVHLQRDYNMHSLVMGVVLIDNYEDITGKTESENSDLITKIRSEINKYFVETYHTYLRRFRNDSYYLVSTYENFVEMEKDKFSIVDIIHNLQESALSVRPTISIGIAYNSPSVLRLNDMCTNALDIALSRGGDQAVVSKYDADMKFYGGKTAFQDNHGRVQLRSMGESLRSIIQGSKEVFVCGHTDADMDAIGSCFGILALCNHLKVRCRIIFDADRTEKKACGAVMASFSKEELQNIVITSKEASEKITPSTLFVLVDTSSPANAMGKEALEKARKTVVIDHHRKGNIAVESPVLEFIDASASSACEMITGLIFYMSANPRVEIPPAYATLMLGGIFLDTNNFESKSTSAKTFEAAQVLKSYKAENDKIYDFFREDINEMRLISSCTSRFKVYNNDIIYCMADDDDIIDEATISKISNQLNHIVGVKACFVIGRVGPNTIKVSARSDGVNINVQLICENIAGKGHGGGHFHMAAARFEGTSVKVGETLLIEALRNHLDEATAYKEGGK